jgi:hypothetical protein
MIHSHRNLIIQSPAFTLLLFGISITAAALAQADTTSTTYKSDVTCQTSFCDAFFEDENICSVTGEGDASVLERDDGECGITILDAEVTCSVPCHQEETNAEIDDGGISITAAALAQADTTSTTYKSDVKCQTSFCDAFFEDENICSVTGEGKASVLERDDGECGITIMDAEVTCSVPCHQEETNTEIDDGNSFAELGIGIALLLLVFVLLAALKNPRARRKRGPEDVLRELSSLVMLEKGLTVGQDENGTVWIKKKNEPHPQDEKDERMKESLSAIFEEQRSLTQQPQDESNKGTDDNDEEVRPLSQLL